MLDHLYYESSFLYFFSSLAQSAAALMAIAAVFATFRLQYNSQHLDNLLRESIDWITARGHRHPADQANFEFVIGKLKELSSIPEVFELLKNLKSAKEFPDKLNLLLALPLKLWAIVFFTSLICIPLFQIERIRLRILVIGSIVMLLILVAWALWETKRFVQKCLEMK